ncbi:hypothetical protein [Actinoplanes sp. CA-252034]|uniref:hypothetical protein n=1 Tax=Actinoplanes sp. CA-252034 TaxID=3239906 RepID=UPI003D997C48
MATETLQWFNDHQDLQTIGQDGGADVSAHFSAMVTSGVADDQPVNSAVISSPPVISMVRFLAPPAVEGERATRHEHDSGPVSMHRLIHPFRVPAARGEPDRADDTRRTSGVR